MFPKYFQEELSNLRELGAEFSKAHPALAPMLSGPQADPDVERLLEGTAFLTSLLRQKLDDEFPEIIHDLLQIVEGGGRSCRTAFSALFPIFAKKQFGSYVPLMTHK